MIHFKKIKLNFIYKNSFTCYQSKNSYCITNRMLLIEDRCYDLHQRVINEHLHILFKYIIQNCCLFKKLNL